MAEETKSDQPIDEAPEAPGDGAPAVQAPEADQAALSLDEVTAWTGYKLDEIGGASVGKVEGAYVDDESGRPEWLLARMGRFGHHCLVPARDAVAAADRVWVPYSRELIRKAPRIEPKSGLERDRERALLEHYGVGSPDTGRGAELAGREPSAITARPA